MVNKLPTGHKNVFTYLIEFLKELLAHSKENGLDSKVLGMLFLCVRCYMNYNLIN